MGNRAIRIGNTGDDVKDAQARLAHLGLLADEGVDGKFGPQTVRAVIAFQRANTLAEDGVVGPGTWAALIQQAPVATLPDKGTAGPALEDYPNVFSPDGWWSGAKMVLANPSRMGGAIRPYAVVVHTTDTLPGTTPAIVRSWSTTPGKRDCANFIIARDGAIIQMVSIYRNANHAGGTIHGNWVGAGGKVYHPNTIATGIEIEAAGRLGKRESAGWVHPDSKRVLPDSEVEVDAKGIGWHKVTPEQYASLGRLLDALEPELLPLDPLMTARPDGGYKENGVAYFAPVTDRPPVIVGHVTLDPVNKTDPGPAVMAWLADRHRTRSH